MTNTTQQQQDRMITLSQTINQNSLYMQEFKAQLEELQQEYTSLISRLSTVKYNISHCQHNIMLADKELALLDGRFTKLPKRKQPSKRTSSPRTPEAEKKAIAALQAAMEQLDPDTAAAVMDKYNNM